MLNTKPQSILAFDFGTRSIGVASGQTLTQSAGELPALRAKEGIPDWLELEALLTEWKPDIVVVGLPVNMDGSEMEMTRRARKFGNRINGRFGYTVAFTDERLSTHEAKAQAAKAGHKGNYREKPIDSLAARIILEGWLNEHPLISAD
ncbi:Holliday junction resolvase RuvX [Teredinibacter purpureus]|jgi:RNAse H-fold protein YqgF|uniref:Holliday junction resolvase RuvX n=1 Tax=Teredinibacter purpureus TaxID=2731756 RepID=UPI0005F7E654|nr:Holliday junction resolvase RuvX [Teredinibacter purpureus]